MTNDVIKQQLPITDIMTIGKAFAESGMFPDIKSAAQAVVKIQAGQEMGITPFAAMSGIHIIAGKPVPGAGIIASKVKSSAKYDYKVTHHDDKKCSIDFYEGKDLIGNSTFTIDDAKKSGTKNLDKFPKNMLFARAISNGQKWFCPDVFLCAVYTLEEMEGVTEDVQHEEVKSNGNGHVHISEPDPKEWKGVPGLWYAKLERCKNLVDLVKLYNEHKETVDADEELKKLFKDKQLSFMPKTAA